MVIAAFLKEVNKMTCFGNNLNIKAEYYSELGGLLPDVA